MIYQEIIYYLGLTFKPDVLWLILPLLASTIIVLAYFGKYREESPGWNSLVANTLVLIFVSMSLLRYIYNFDSHGTVNFLLFQEETIFAASILILGIIILTVNFKHILPEKIAEKISSPITVNTLAYIGILFVYSGEPDLTRLSLSPPSTAPGEITISLAIIFFGLIIIFHLLHAFFMKTFMKIEKEKKKEKIRDITKEKARIRKEKREIKMKELQLKKTKLKEFEKQKREALKLKRVVRKP